MRTLSVVGSAAMIVASPTVLAFVPPTVGAPPTAMAVVPSLLAHLGGNRTAGGESFSAPSRDVAVAAFAIDRTEVTVEAYAKCVMAGGCAPPTKIDCEVPEAMTWGKAGHERHPVNCVSYVDAERYCAWVGKRLPTGSEWEVAQRGPTMSTFPWGDALPTLGAANGCDHSCATVARAATGFDYEPVWADKSFDDGWPMTAPAGSFPGDVSAFGVFDLAGNLAEWTNPVGETDLGGSVAYTPKVVLGDKQLRGGSWATNVFSTMSFAGRDQVDASFRGGWVGFRCARGL